MIRADFFYFLFKFKTRLKKITTVAQLLSVKILNVMEISRIAELLHDHKIPPESIIEIVQLGIEYKRLLAEAKKITNDDDNDFLKSEKVISDAQLLISLLGMVPVDE
jgi:hypothetical protein